MGARSNQKSNEWRTGRFKAVPFREPGICGTEPFLVFRTGISVDHQILLLTLARSLDLTMRAVTAVSCLLGVQ